MTLILIKYQILIKITPEVITEYVYSLRLLLYSISNAVVFHSLFKCLLIQRLKH